LDDGRDSLLRAVRSECQKGAGASKDRHKFPLVKPLGGIIGSEAVSPGNYRRTARGNFVRA
jgi:hypothetical protein